MKDLCIAICFPVMGFIILIPLIFFMDGGSPSGKWLKKHRKDKP